MEEQKETAVEKASTATKPQKEKKAPSLLFKVKKNGRHVSPCMTFLRTCILPFVRFFYPFKAIGAKKVADGPCVYVSNHYRMVDPMYVIPTTKEGIHFIAKKESLNMPIFAFFLKKLKTIFVNRDGNDARAIMDGLKCLKHGDKLAVYPEGKRNTTDQTFLPFKSGCALFAIRAKVPVVPVVLYGKARFLRKNYALYGEPFDLREYYGQKLTEEVLREADAKILAKMQALWTEFDQTMQKKKGKKKCK